MLKITFIRYAQNNFHQVLKSQKIEKPNNSKVYGNKKTKGFKQESPTLAEVPCASGRRTIVLIIYLNG
jgi:hypothetical protein